MVGACHDGCAAKGIDGVGNALIVGGDQNGIHQPRGLRASIDVFDHRVTGDGSEGFSGETSGVISGGDDGNNPTQHTEPSGKDYWHEES